MDLVIYGAQGIALGTYDAIRELYPKKNINCFLVTRREKNADILAGIPVIELEKFASDLNDKENVEILIATPENVIPEIEGCLQNYGLYKYSSMTSVKWAKLMSYYFIKKRMFIPLSTLPVRKNMAKLHVYMARHCLDKQLSSKYSIPEWITPIQVGAVLAEQKIENITDSDGENISFKNPNYSELTALYWLWKNGIETDGYYGICHYRRYLELSDEDMLRLEENSVDVVLPYPMPYEPDIEEHHKRYLNDSDWQAVLLALGELAPEYTENLKAVLKGRYFFNYNIFVARKQAFSAYCEWLFPILERIEEVSMPRGSERKDRYIGYIGETLATLYFMANKNQLHIKYTGCLFFT